MCTNKLVEKSLLNIQVTYRFVVQPARSPLSIIRWFPSRSPGGLLEKAGVGDWEERESMLPVGVSSLGELWLSARKETTRQKDTKRIFSWAKGGALVTMSKETLLSHFHRMFWRTSNPPAFPQKVPLHNFLHHYQKAIFTTQCIPGPLFNMCFMWMKC